MPSDSENDEMAMLTRQFKKFLKLKKRGSGNSKPFQKKDFLNKFESNKKYDIVCYECKKQGHMREECPELKKKLKKEKFTFKKANAILATWSDEDEDKDSQHNSGDDEVHGLMARSNDSTEEPQRKGAKEIHKYFMAKKRLNESRDSRTQASVGPKTNLISKLRSLAAIHCKWIQDIGCARQEMIREHRRTVLQKWDSVSTQPEVVSTLVTLPRELILPVWDSVSTHSVVVSTHSS
ncbi:hypothetical protein Taro_026151 [Colocasia esculenta]|uniref:CCHC-type domain-containing protein n=1 Tax=Colocasia esculenta TaxID=4460 RepID=A0A843VQG5_COLES|nr:hypothetical protein [Colocasia esculenta]